MPTTISDRLARTVVIASIAVGLLGACGDGSDETTTSTTTETDADAAGAGASTPTTGAPPEAGEEDLAAYCAVARQLVGLTPTADQLAEYADLAPEAIAAPVETFVAAFEDAAGDLEAVFADPAASAAAEEIGAFEAEECGIAPAGPPPGAEG